MVLRPGCALLQARDEFDGLGDFGTHVADHWEVYRVRGQRKMITHTHYILLSREADLVGHWIHLSQIGLLTHLFILLSSRISNILSIQL
jgi:hypothetical protein